MLSSLISPKLTDSLGWTLLHSLWQGAVIAILMSVALLLLNRRSARVRYFVTVSALFSMFVAAICTFCILYVTQQTPVGDSVMQVVDGSSVVNVTLTNSISPEVKTPDSWAAVASHWFGYFEQHTPLIVTLWLVGILVLTLRFMGGLMYLQRLKNYQTQIVPEEWIQKINVLREQIGLSRAVKLMESALIKVPMAIGYFKPVILLPIGTFTGLTSQQVESILAHELAHIVRNDYWINIFQSVIEILFFFHPAVWWMSGIVRQEREHCCDDMAVQLSGDSLVFAQALTNLEVMQTVPQLAMGATGNRGSLLVRIQRLLQQPPQKPTFNEGLLVSGILIFCLVAISASAYSNLNQSTPEMLLQNSISSTHQTPSVDSTLNKTTFYGTFTDTNKVVREIMIVKDKKGRVTEVTIDGRKLSASELKNYRQVIDQKLTQAKKEDDERFYSGDRSILFPPTPVAPVAPVPPVAPVSPLSEMASLPPIPPLPPVFGGDEQELNEHATAYDEKKVAAIEKKRAELEKQLNKLDEELSKKYGQNQRQFDKQYQAQLEDYMIQLKKYQRDVEQQLQEKSLSARSNEELRSRLEMEKSQRMLDQERKIEEIHQELAMREHDAAMREHEKAMAEHDKAMIEHKKAMEKHEKFMKLLASEMKNDGLILNEKSYSIKLTNKKLYINDKEQPDSVFQKYKKLIKQQTGEDIEKWSDKSQFSINNNHEEGRIRKYKDTINPEDNAESSTKQPAYNFTKLFLWNLNDVLKKPDSKEGC